MYSQSIQTVTGNINFNGVEGVIDGHTHLWIEDVGAIASQAPILNDMIAIKKDVNSFYEAGGRWMLDCQPPGCGRNANELQEISEATQVKVVCCTGFHLRQYYPPKAPIFDMDTEDACQYFVSELREGLAEAPHIKAGFIKIACEKRLEVSPKHLITAAVQASIKTGAAIEVHTERGSDAENIMSFMLRLGVPPTKLILCHMDKHAEFTLHRKIAEQGVLLEYDTFVRPKYEPNKNVWQLLPQMLDAGFEDKIILATDLADPQMWVSIAGGYGKVAMISEIKARLSTMRLSETTIKKLVGENIAKAIAF